MAGAPDDDRAAVLAVVEAFFTDLEHEEELFGGPFRDWLESLRNTDDEPPRHAALIGSRSLDRAELVELDAEQALVEVRGEHRWSRQRGRHETRVRLDGPIRLAKEDGVWRIVDFTLDGRSRLRSIVRGNLAEQEQAGVAVRVIGVDRSVHRTSIWVEVANGTDVAVQAVSAFVLLAADGSWAKTPLRRNASIEPESRRLLLLGASGGLDLTADTELLLAMRLRAGARRLDYRVRVPLQPTGEPVLQPRPQRLPLFRSTWPRNLLMWTALTAVAAWFIGWIAVAIPVYLGLYVYAQYRTRGLLPQRTHRYRFALDAAVIVFAVLLLWETPAADLAVPTLVASLVFVAAAALRPSHDQFAFLAAIAIATGWFFVLGTPDKPLSPCRLVDGNPRSVSDAFASSLFTGDLPRADGLELAPNAVATRELAPKPVSAAAAQVAVARGSSLARGSALCKAFGEERDTVACFAYRLPRRTALASRLFDGVSCDERDWRVSGWYP